MNSNRRMRVISSFVLNQYGNVISYLKCMAVSSNLDAANIICESLAIFVCVFRYCACVRFALLFHNITSKSLESFIYTQFHTCV